MSASHAVAFSLPLLAALLFPTVAAASVRLDVPWHRQEHSLSCEIATLKMALAGHDIEISETELISQLPFDPTPKQAGQWGDPNRGFVGNIDGQMLVDGYGVYWDPIAQVGSRYAPTTVLRHGSPPELARHLAAGNPVIIWGYYGQRAVYNWQTPGGNTVNAVGGQHTRIVYGFDGTVENPTRFYLHDPLSGSMSWSTAELMFNWSALQHMGVVVHPPRQWVRVAGDTKVWEIEPKAATRRWVTTWSTFVERGGRSEAIKTIAESTLVTYTRGADIK